MTNSPAKSAGNGGVLSGGVRLGPYEVLAPLGAGGMGEVYRARDTRLDREVAIKIISDRIAADPTALRRFENEAKAVASLSHPNILAIHDFRTENGISFTVMELLRGESLARRLTREHLSGHGGSGLRSRSGLFTRILCKRRHVNFASEEDTGTANRRPDPQKVCTPSLVAFRHRGVRSRNEIDREKFALKALRGDFARAKKASSAMAAAAK